MPHHFQKGIDEMIRWCNKCGRETKHIVSDGRQGRCKEHEVAYYSKEQLKRKQKAEKDRQNPRLF